MARATNSAKVGFGTPTGNWSDATWYSLWQGATFLQRRALTNNPSPARSGDTVEFAIGDLELTLTAGTGTDATFAKDVLEEYLDNHGIQVRLHSGDPGANGTANTLTGNGYAHGAIAAGAWAVVE